MAPLALLERPPATTPEPAPLVERQENPPGLDTVPARIVGLTAGPRKVAGGVFNVANGSPAATSSAKPSESRSTTSSSGGAVPTSMLDEAAAALQTVALQPNVTGSEWLRAARLLRSAALERRVVAPRIASVAVLLSDALTFTQPTDVSPAQRGALRSGLKLLTQPFVSTVDEGSLVDALLDNGWDVMASFQAEALGDLANVFTED